MRLSYKIWTQDSHEWILAFYGFGQQAEVFLPLIQTNKLKTNLIVIDLPYSKRDHPISKLELKQFIEELIHHYKIKTFTGISYSMGSRFNLCLVDLLPTFFKQLFLIAPDGIRISFWNQMATNTILGNKLFHYFTQHQTAYSRVISLLYKLHIMPKKLYAFSKWHMRNHETRAQVFNSWMNMKLLVPDLHSIQKNIETYRIPINAYFGLNDTIIDTECMNKLIEQMPTAQIIKLNKGHQLLNQEIFNTIASQI